MAFSDAPRCTATAKHTRQRCKNAAVRGYPTCRFHGAGSPNIGRAGGRPVIHGRYSSRLPERLASRYEQALADTRLLELRDEIALTDSLLGDQVERLDSATSKEREQALQAAYAALQVAIAANDSVRFQAANRTLGNAIDSLGQYRRQVDDVLTLVDTRRKLVESERRRHVEMQLMISSERAMILLAAVVDIIRRHVHEPTTLASISTSIRALVSHGDGGAVDATG